MSNFYKTIKVDREVLVKWIKATINKGHYHLGKKLAMGMQLSDWHNPEVDCSGLVRLFLNRITFDHLIIPDGSWHQNKWAMGYPLRPCDYSDCAKLDDRLRIAFMAPGRGKHGHVWLCVNGHTIESYGGHGPGRRAWNVKPLLSRVSTCYLLTEPMNTSS